MLLDMNRGMNLFHFLAISNTRNALIIRLIRLNKEFTFFEYLFLVLQLLYSTP